jgi:hypothetical protein
MALGWENALLSTDGTLPCNSFPSSQPRSGGEYKAWMTKVGDYDTTMTKGSFSFIPSKSKTDNFKVASHVDDFDGDGIPDSEDPCPFDSNLDCLEG